MPLLQIGTAISYCKLTLAKIYCDAFSVFPFIYEKVFQERKLLTTSYDLGTYIEQGGVHK